MGFRPTQDKEGERSSVGYGKMLMCELEVD